MSPRSCCCLTCAACHIFMSELTSTHAHARTHARTRTHTHALVHSLVCTPVNTTCIPSQCPCNATTGAKGMACSSDCRPAYLCKLRDIAAVRACPVSCASARRRQRQGGQHPQRCEAGDVHRGGLRVRGSCGGHGVHARVSNFHLVNLSHAMRTATRTGSHPRLAFSHSTAASSRTACASIRTDAW